MTDFDNFGDAEIVKLTGKNVVVAVLILLFFAVFFFSLHLYVKYVWYRHRENSNTPTRHRDLAGEQQEIAAPHHGLEPSLLKALPVLIFDPKSFKDGLECIVCLSKISTGEQIRLLPKCNHGFHLGCIDMWFESHSTCPLCRNPIKNQNQSGEEPPPAVVQAPAVEVLTEPPNFPTNVLIWGNETQVSTSALCVEETINVEPSSSSSTNDLSANNVNIHDDDEHKFLMATRLIALKGLLDYNNRRVNPSSPRNLDLEQGGREQS